MTYKIRHKGKHKESGLAPGLVAPIVQVVVIVALLITAVLLPRPAEGKTDIVSVVALTAGVAGAALGGLTRLAQGVLSRTKPRTGGATAATWLYRISFVLVVSGLAAAFYRTIFR